MPASDNEEDDDFSFLAELVQSDLLKSQSADRERAEIAEASLSAIRDRIVSLHNQDYLPNPKLVLEGLFPPKEIIDEYRNRST